MKQSNSMLERYMDFTRTTAIYPLEQSDPKVIEALYLGNGLSSEVGEVTGIIKKIHRDGFIEGLKEKVRKEIGDCMWYIVRLCDIFHIDIAEMLEENMKKLQDRKNRGVLGGSGDNR